MGVVLISGNAVAMPWLPKVKGLMQGWFLAHHQFFVKQKTNIIGRRNAEHKSTSLAIYPKGAIVLTGCHRGESYARWVGIEQRQSQRF